MAERIDLDRAVGERPGWAAAPEGREAIVRTYRFADFAAAWRWMGRVAEKAEAMDHHPEWTNVYDRVDVTLTTHDAGGVTERDILLAEFMDAAAAEVQGSGEA